eukprot:jgi/Psemu1/287953/fgenesh1_pg.224_\
MTAKNKRKTAISRMEKRLEREEKMKDIPVYDGENKYSDVEPPTLESSYKPFTTAQLGALVFLMAGASKIYELTVALEEDETKAPSCMAYLNNDETTCQHPHFKSLIQAKYYSAISLAGLVTIYILQLWSSEYYFMKFMNCLSISPLFTTFLAIVALPFTIESSGEDGVLSKGKMWELCTVLTILYGTVAPKTVDDLRFLRARRNKILSKTAKALVYFWMVDKIAMAILYTFAVVHLPVFKQRAILVAACGIKMCEYYMQLPRMNDPWKDQDTIVYPMTMGLAVLSGVAWFM